MAVQSTREAFVFCDKCKQNIALPLSDADRSSWKGGLLTLVSVHGSPQHALIAYVDSQLKIRGVEYPGSVHIRVDSQSPPDLTSLAYGKEGQLTLAAFVDTFGEKRKDAVRALAYVVTQLMFHREVVLVHDDDAIGESIGAALIDLLGGQRISVKVVDHASVDSLESTASCIYDLQEAKFMKEGEKPETRFFEQLVKELVDEEDGFFRLRNELSKILFAYDRMMRILATETGMHLDTKLAHDAAIDLSLFPTLLAMAESDGVDISSRIERDDIGRAIRSI
jgi:hypothetical protein